MVAAAMLCAGLSAHAEQFSFTNRPNTTIADGNPTGLATTIPVTGLAGWLTNVTLSLTVTGGYNGDLYAYLTADNGGYAVLLNRSGKTSTSPFGYEDAGFDVILEDLATLDIHGYGGNSGNLVTGTWQPDGRDMDPQNVLDTSPRTAFLDSFNGRNPNGIWTLYVSDMAGNGQVSTLVGWRLNFEAVPEPVAGSLLLLGGGILALTRRWRNPLPQRR